MLRLTSIPIDQCQTFWLYLNKRHSIHAVKQLNEKFWICFMALVLVL